MAVNGTPATQRDIDRLREDIGRMHSEQTAALAALANHVESHTSELHSHRLRLETRVSTCEGERAGSKTMGARLATHAGLLISVFGLAATWVALLSRGF